jgi:hypothetical protein
MDQLLLHSYPAKKEAEELEEHHVPIKQQNEYEEGAGQHPPNAFTKLEFAFVSVHTLANLLWSSILLSLDACANRITIRVKLPPTSQRAFKTKPRKPLLPLANTNVV